MFEKISPKFYNKTVQSCVLWLNLNKIDEISFFFFLQSAHKLVFYNQHINKVTPHFTFMRRAQNADTYALKQHRLSQNISPDYSSFVLVIASDMHLESQSKTNKQTTTTTNKQTNKQTKTPLIFTQLKISRYNQHFFAIFRRILIN